MLRLFDKYNNGGTFYIVSWDGNVIEEEKQGNNINPKIKVGDCSCPNNHTLFQLDITTDNYPEDFSWELVNTNNTDLANRNKYEDANKYYYYRECVKVTNNEFATLRIIVSYGNGGTF